MLIRNCLAALMLAILGSGCGQVEMFREQDKIDVKINGKFVTSYLFKSDLTKPVLYPLNTLSGVTVSRQFPLQIVEGESKDHPHHFGLFFTYDRVNGVGFWNNTAIPPQIKLVEIKKVENGKTGTISSVHHWVAPNGKILLQEDRSMQFIPSRKHYAIDFSIQLTAKDTAVVFEDTKEGMFSIRVADWLAEKSGHAEYLSSNGDRKEKEVWGKRAVWVRLEGAKNGQPLGIAMIHHPNSVNYPTFWHARGYGLFAANPLGQETFERDHNVENPKAFRLTLAKGESAWFKFRVVVYDGAMDKAAVDAIAADYAKTN
ncbi:MAG TPA: PmoA family protein [bacterium]|nr:PmoA family protein [bacterium]